MKIAVEGCAHGELDKIYEALGTLEKQNNMKVDLLIICGDFQSVRNPADLQCMAVPPKYRAMNTFYKYYSGEKIAPVLTVFIGGNHEASNYLSELSYGGWVCPNIYYMGYANVINVGGIRIAGLSGIYKGRDYMKGHFEVPPYDESSKKSVYHVRNIDVFRLKQIQSPIDICISHDWPRGVYHYGNKQELLRFKPFFKDEMESNQLGSQPAEELLEKLKPSYWFAAHLHCKFTAVVPHNSKERPMTKFLALDKCLPRRKFLQVLEMDKKCDTVHIEYDPEWLCILRNTNHLINTSRRNTYMPGPGSDERWDFAPTEEEIKTVLDLFGDDFKIPDNFQVTASTYNPSVPLSTDKSLKTYMNPQTQLFCEILSISDVFTTAMNKSSGSFSISDFSCTDPDITCSSLPSLNPAEISISDESDKDDEIVVENNQNLEDTSDFFIDKTGSLRNTSESDGFFIDNTGSNHDTSGTCDFFIDRVGALPNVPDSDDAGRKTHSSNLVPEKTVASPLSQKTSQLFLNTSELCSTPLPKAQTQESFPELKETVQIEEDQKRKSDTEEELPVVRKLKRRNLALYTSECDIST